jgi:aminoglycoside phosphotransferase (APT) family kinase protein
MSDYKARLEAELLALPEEQAERLQLLLREGRGAWLLCARTACGNSALFRGHPRSGAVSALALCGYEVWVETDDEAAWEAARKRAEAHTPGRVRRRDGTAPRRFALVVVEQPGALDVPDCEELVYLCDNRFGYKRSLGRKGEFRVPGAAEYLRHALLPAHDEHGLGGYRRVLRRTGRGAVEAFALYPHREDFSHVVALDAPMPALSIGPMERKNWLKLWGARLGLFPHLTPSFALLARTQAAARAPTRLEAYLEAAASALGTPTPRVETIVATRGNSAVVHTRDPHWTLHVPLAPKNFPQTARHAAHLRALQARFPEFPAPRLIFEGERAGLYASIEERLPGWTAPQACGDQPRIARMLRETAQALTKLIVEPARVCDEALFAEQVEARLRLVIAHAEVPQTVRWLEELLASSWRRLRGQPLPLCFYHADLRAKHVQVDEQGGLLGVLDWGTAEERGLPYYDLLQLVCHEIKQEHRLSIGQAWRRLLAGELRPFEREVLEAYRQALGLVPAVAEALHELYPALVAAMAEKNWDYSRPRWLHRQFGV